MTLTFSPRRRKTRLIRRYILGGLFFLCAVGAWGVYAILGDLPQPERITERSVAESTKIYDRTGAVLLYEIHGEENRTVIALKDIPREVKLATLAAEDLYFYSHRGLDWRGIVRAIGKDIIARDLAQGGSTITQQLVKSSLLGGEKTFQRKIREQILAILVERKYSKDEILELYLNQIPYGSNAYGVAAAAQTFFAKDPRELSLAEAAMLAALPKAPTYYSPYGAHKEELIARRNWILDRMADAQFVSKEDAEKAKKKTLSFAPPAQSIRAPHFVFYVREYLNQKYGEDLVEQGGLKVITTLDWHLEAQAEKIIKEGAERNEKLVEASNAALVAIDPKNGEILAMVGSRDYWEPSKPDGCTPGANCRFDPGVNVALRPRQPGSAFKPFVYAAAFKKGFTPETVLFDVPTEFNPLCNSDGTPTPLLKNPDDCYHPKNYDGRFRGPVTLRQSLAQSLNIPSVKLLYLAGVNDSIETAEAMGISTLKDRSRFGLSLVLGGAEVTLLEMTSAFGIFAREGMWAAPHTILRVENAKGDLLEKKDTPQTEVLDAETARTINDLLSDNNARVPVFNPQSALYFPDRDVAAKTGTTQDARDGWVVGYTPSLAVGVWTGNSDNTPMNKTALSVLVAAPMWHDFLAFALEGATKESFSKPDSPLPEKPALRGVYRNGETVKIDKISRKLATAFTPPELVQEISFGKVQTILSFLNKDDPTGPAPQNPEADPQVKNWQAGIDQWLNAHKLEAGEPPKEFDDVHTTEKKPRLTFLSPAENTGTEETVSHILIEVNAAFELREVSLFVNETLISSRVGPLGSGTIDFPLEEALAAGVYKIKITAYDAVGNRESKEKEITVLR